MTDAAPAAAERADTLSDLIAKGEAMKEAFFTGDDNREAIACIEWDAAVEAARPAPAAAPRAGGPTIVCLCGSTRFVNAFADANTRETLAGRIVLTVGCIGANGCPGHTDDEKRVLDTLHFRKIDLADEILVLNVGGYVGESTGREIAYARSLGKRVRWLEGAAGEAARGEGEATP